MDAIMRVLSRVWVAAAVLLSVALWAGGAQAALQGRTVPSNGDPISIELDEGQLVRLDRSMASVFIANPEIADVTAKSDRLLYLFGKRVGRSEEYTSEIQSLLRHSYAVFCLKKKQNNIMHEH